MESLIFSIALLFASVQQLLQQEHGREHHSGQLGGPGADPHPGHRGQGGRQGEGGAGDGGDGGGVLCLVPTQYYAVFIVYYNFYYVLKLLC